jgi:hypothetical protein
MRFGVEYKAKVCDMCRHLTEFDRGFDHKRDRSGNCFVFGSAPGGSRPRSAEGQS